MGTAQFWRPFTRSCGSLRVAIKNYEINHGFVMKSRPHHPKPQGKDHRVFIRKKKNPCGCYANLPTTAWVQHTTSGCPDKPYQVKDKIMQTTKKHEKNALILILTKVCARGVTTEANSHFHEFNSMLCLFVRCGLRACLCSHFFMEKAGNVKMLFQSIESRIFGAAAVASVKMNKLFIKIARGTDFPQHCTNVP